MELETIRTKVRRSHEEIMAVFSLTLLRQHPTYDITVRVFLHKNSDYDQEIP